MAFSASFTIKSASGAILASGSKTLSTSSGVFCMDTLGDVDGFTTTTYQATIFTASGNYADQGTSFLQLGIEPNNGTGVFDETFASTLTQPVLISLTSTDQCKDGGWKNYPQFKNQGDCVSFVATGGKNAPSNP